MNYDEFNAGIQSARSTLNLADKFTNTMASLLVGRLQHVSAHWLRALKNELRDFDSRDGSWK